MKNRKILDSVLLIGGSLVLSLSFAISAQAVCRTDIRQDTPDSRFVVNADGTVKDTKTQLTWKRCPEGLSGAACNIGTAQRFTWKVALDNAAVTSFAGFSDWRVPNIKELQSIVERRCYGPSINETVFPNTPSDRFWSSSVNASVPFSAWVVYFGSGDDGNGVKNDNYYVRLVRSGQ